MPTQAQRMARFRRRQRSGRKVVLSEGDSWFSYEFFPSIIDLLDDMETFAHLRLEMSGDTVHNMIGTKSKRRALRQVAEQEHALFLLFSGGGNDIQMASDGELFVDGDAPEDCIDPERADQLFVTMRDQYEALIEEVGSAVPIAAHGYDFFQPTAEPVRLAGLDIGIGPWIHPNMIAAGIEDPEKQRAVADLLVNRFNDDLAQLEEDHPNDFIYIDLRGTLEPVDDWENEIHPTRDGFRKVTDKIWDAINERVRTLVEARLWDG
jgi:hypothetical protein